VLIGATAGYYGGWRDGLLMRVAELFVALPWLYCSSRSGILAVSGQPVQAFFLIILVIGAWVGRGRHGWCASVAERKRAHFVRAARGFGATDGYLLRATSCRKLPA